MNHPQLDSYITECQACGGLLAVQTSQIGRRGRCPLCRESIVVSSVRPADQSGEKAAGSVETASDSNLLSTEKSEKSEPVAGSGQLGRFELQRKLGRGAFGEVWLARDTHLDRAVAIKLPIFKTKDKQRMRRFLAEAKSSASLRHPNIVPTLDAGRIDRRYYIASEYVRGTPLSKINSDGKSPQRWAAETVMKLAEALHYAHDQQIIHRDIKPDNVIVDRHGQPQLLDFGLAKDLTHDTSHTLDGTVLGTPAYMSPEQARGAIDEIGPHSDQFSLGVVLYRLLAGKTPFQGSAIVVLQQVIHQSPPKLVDLQLKVDPDLEAICEKARAKSPEDRYVDCQAFADDLKRFLNGRSVRARPPSIVTRAIRWTNDHRRETALAILCLIIGTTTLVASGTGWASAQSAASAAESIEREVRIETVRLVDLETKIQLKVDEAKSARDLALKAKKDETEQAMRLQSQNELMRKKNEETEQAIRDAEEKSGALSQAESSLSEIQNKLKATQDNLGSIAKPTDKSPPPETDLNPFLENKIQVDGRWDRERMALNYGGEKKIKVLREYDAPSPLVDLETDSDGRLIFGTTRRRFSPQNPASKWGITNRSEQKVLVPFVPLDLSNSMNQRAGRFPGFSGHFAVDKALNVYFIYESRFYECTKSNDNPLFKEVNVYNTPKKMLFNRGIFNYDIDIYDWQNAIWITQHRHNKCIVLLLGLPARTSYDPSNPDRIFNSISFARKFFSAALTGRNNSDLGISGVEFLSPSLAMLNVSTQRRGGKRASVLFLDQELAQYFLLSPLEVSSVLHSSRDGSKLYGLDPNNKLIAFQILDQ